MSGDIALGVVAAILAAAPLSVLLLLVADVLPTPDDVARRRWMRRCLAALGLPALLLLGVSAWGWAGAAHLQPLCAAYATPDFRAGPRRAASTLALDLGPAVAPGGSAAAAPAPASAAGASAVPRLPAWAAYLRAPRGPFVALEVASGTAATSAPLRLEVRRATHHENAWWRVQMERFRLVEARSGITIAAADELWIEAGRARYHCGVGSGPNPVATTDWPANDGVARFVAQALRGRAP